MRARFFILATILTVGACQSDQTSPDGAAGIVTFTYSGDAGGTFSTSGSMPATATARQTTDWAAGELLPSHQTVTIEGFIARTSTTHDRVSIDIERTTAGSVPITTAFDRPGSVAVAFGWINGTGNTAKDCYLSTGSITITEISESRVKGTFSGTGQCMAAGATSFTAFTVSNGTFDVPLVDIPFIDS